MATLYIRDVPDDLYQRPRSTAERDRRSVGSATIEIPQRELAQEKQRSTSELLARARAVRGRSRPAKGSPTVVEDVRADRER
jgi:plasmid stability protein